MSIPLSQFVTPYPSPLGNRKFVLYIFDSISALQINSSVPFFWIPHRRDIIRYLFFSFWLHSAWQSLGPSMSLQMALFLSFFMAEWYCIVCMYHIFFIHSSVDGHLGCFHVLATVNSALAADFNQTFLVLHLRLCFVAERLSHYSGLPEMLTIWRTQFGPPAMNLYLRTSVQYPKKCSSMFRPWKVR